MVETAVEILDCNRDKLLDEFKKVHQTHHDSELPFALLETETVKKTFAGLNQSHILKQLDPAFYAFNSSKKKTLKLHEGVEETLDLLVQNEIKLIAHTESRLQGALDRINRLGIAKYFSKIYCRERSITVHPDTEYTNRWLAKFSLENVYELAHHQSKPNPEVLVEICSSENIKIQEAAYVGDSIAKDIMMAKQAGVFSIWAAYGSKHNRELYSSLVRISHWTPEDIIIEEQLRPDYIVKKSFRDVFEALQFAESVQ
jgi:phosphoglycolate phosphatase